MIIINTLADGRTHIYSDEGYMIMREDGVVFEDAIDVVAHSYTETQTHIPTLIEEEATIEDYEAALAELGVK